jgi:hypothetical protein
MFSLLSIVGLLVNVPFYGLIFFLRSTALDESRTSTNGRRKETRPSYPTAPSFVLVLVVANTSGKNSSME